jgi:hypothetical protein
MEWTDVYRVFSPAITQYIFFSAAHGTFYNIEHNLDQKASLKTNMRKLKSTPSIISEHNAVKLELNNKNSSRKYTNNCRSNDTLLID